jgi:Double-stranded RNA binding motif
MPTATTTTLPLTIRLTEAQLGYLAYRYPETDPEDALVLLLERERVRSLKRANERGEVIRFNEESTTPETEPDLPTDSDNPIGTIHEYCQRNQLPLPNYSYTPVEEGFCCTVEGLGLTVCAIAANKKKAKTEAAGVLLGMLHRLSFNKNEKIGVDQECQGQIN